MKERPGDKVLEAKYIAELSAFGSTQLVSNVKHVTKNSNQIFSSVANSLRMCLLAADKEDTCESEVTSCRAVCNGCQLLAVGNGHCIQ